MIRAVVVAVILAQPGSSYTKLMTTRFENPTFAFTGSVLVETSQNGAIVNFLFIAHNPNEAGLKNITCSYELFVEVKKFATGKDFTLALDPKGDTQITVCCGSTEAMMATMMAIVDPGDEVIVFEPYYENYGPDAVLSGATPRFVSLRWSDASRDWTFDSAELAAALSAAWMARAISLRIVSDWS